MAHLYKQLRGHLRKRWILITLAGMVVLIPSASAAVFSQATLPPVEPEITVALPTAPAVKETKKVTVTAYASVPAQTDDTPFITADGSRVRDGIIAANFLPIGTQVRMPELYGDKVFEVHDRMHRRFRNRVDIWMDSNRKSIEFGIRRQVTLEILDSTTKTTAP